MGLFTKMRMKEPVSGAAQVISVTAHRGDSSWQDIQMTLSVRAEGVPPTTVRHRGMCRADRWPMPGQVLPVTLDRRKPERLAKLRESGALTDAEFQAEKARILGRDS